MNCASIIGCITRKVVNPLFGTSANILNQQIRNVYVLKRRNPPPLRRVGRKEPPRLTRRHFIYDLIQDTNVIKKKPIEILLTTFVEDVGDVGDRVFMGPYAAYHNYLVTGKAVYATPENIKKYEDVIEHRPKVEYSSPYIPRTIKTLQSLLVHVFMSYDNPWTLENWHIKVALRSLKVHVDDDCITLPEIEISGPKDEMENKEFPVTITMNKREQTLVRCRLHLWSKQATNNIIDYDTFMELAEPLYPEFKETLDSLPLPAEIEEKLKQKPRIPRME